MNDNQNVNLGSLIGMVVDNFSITNDAKDKVQVRLTFDFASASNGDIVNWLVGNRRIALQRPARAMSKDELEGLNGTVVPAIDAGKKVKTRAEKLAVYTSIGLPLPMAELAIDNPEGFKNAMATVSKDE